MTLKINSLLNTSVNMMKSEIMIISNPCGQKWVASHLPNIVWIESAFVIKLIVGKQAEELGIIIIIV